jgi:hypothetical protein
VYGSPSNWAGSTSTRLASSRALASATRRSAAALTWGALAPWALQVGGSVPRTPHRRHCWPVRLLLCRQLLRPWCPTSSWPCKYGRRVQTALIAAYSGPDGSSVMT